jgi:hypothetical protein
VEGLALGVVADSTDSTSLLHPLGCRQPAPSRPPFQMGAGSLTLLLIDGGKLLTVAVLISYGGVIDSNPSET